MTTLTLSDASLSALAPSPVDLVGQARRAADSFVEIAERYDDVSRYAEAAACGANLLDDYLRDQANRAMSLGFMTSNKVLGDFAADSGTMARTAARLTSQVEAFDSQLTALAPPLDQTMAEQSYLANSAIESLHICLANPCAGYLREQASLARLLDPINTRSVLGDLAADGGGAAVTAVRLTSQVEAFSDQLTALAAPLGQPLAEQSYQVASALESVAYRSSTSYTDRMLKSALDHQRYLDDILGRGAWDAMSIARAAARSLDSVRDYVDALHSSWDEDSDEEDNTDDVSSSAGDDVEALDEVDPQQIAESIDKVDYGESCLVGLALDLYEVESRLNAALGFTAMSSQQPGWVSVSCLIFMVERQYPIVGALVASCWRCIRLLEVTRNSPRGHTRSGTETFSLEDKEALAEQFRILKALLSTISPPDRSL